MKTIERIKAMVAGDKIEIEYEFRPVSILAKSGKHCDVCCFQDEHGHCKARIEDHCVRNQVHFMITI